MPAPRDHHLTAARAAITRYLVASGFTCEDAASLAQSTTDHLLDELKELDKAGYSPTR